MPRRPYRPPFSLTPALLNACAEIMALVGRVAALPTSTPRVELRRRNRIRTVHATVAIEGGRLTEAQVTAILDGKRVLGAPAEIREVENAIAAYERSPRLKPGRVADLLAAHAVLMRGLAPDAGRFRLTNVGVLEGTRVAHMAPPAARVPALVAQLLEFVARDREIHPLIKATVAHYEIEFIHPFSDGNGRLGRLWQHRILLDVHSVFAHVPFESVVRARQKAYHDALGKADRAGEATPFLLFALEATRRALADLVGEIRTEPATSATRLQRARAHFGRKQFSRADYAKLTPTISTATASRDLREGVDGGVLTRTGDKATARYRFASR